MSFLADEDESRGLAELVSYLADEPVASGVLDGALSLCSLPGRCLPGGAVLDHGDLGLTQVAKLDELLGSDLVDDVADRSNSEQIASVTPLQCGAAEADAPVGVDALGYRVERITRRLVNFVNYHSVDVI